MSVICEDCDREFRTDANLKMHRDIKHSGPQVCAECGFQAKNGHGLRLHAAKKHRDDTVYIEPSLSAGPDDIPAPPREATSGPAPSTFNGPELPPSEPKTWRDRLWNAGKRKPKDPDEPKTKERKPRFPVGRRVDAADFWSSLYGGAGSLAVMSGLDVPAGRTMQFQSDVAGAVLEKRIKGTPLDRLLQPWIQRADDTRDLFDVVLLPLVVSRMWRHPEEKKLLEPIAKGMIRRNLVLMAPVVKKKKAEERKLADAVADLDLGLEPGEDPVDAIFAAIFAPPPQPEPTPDAAMNGQGAAHQAAAPAS